MIGTCCALQGFVHPQGWTQEDTAQMPVVMTASSHNFQPIRARGPLPHIEELTLTVGLQRITAGGCSLMLLRPAQSAAHFRTTKLWHDDLHQAP